MSYVSTDIAEHRRLGASTVGMVLAAIALAVAVAAAALAITHAGPHGVTGAAGPQGPPGASASTATLKKQVARLSASNAKMTACVPELTKWINSFSVETSTQSGNSAYWLTGAYLDTSHQQVSKDCAKVLGLPTGY
jgi:hypothetical protein